MSKIYWLEKELTRHFKDANLSVGVDLDRNGKIEGSEHTDLNGNGDVDVSEWKKFLVGNSSKLSKMGGFFKYYYKYGQAFERPNNPIHDRMYIESRLRSEDQIRKAYKTTEGILNIVKKRVQAKGGVIKFKFIYDTMVASGLKFVKHGPRLFTDSIEKGEIACNPSSCIALFVSFEMYWPVYLVGLPDHVFVRYDNGKGKRYNMDRGRNNSDKGLAEIFNVSKMAINKKVYLKNMSSNEVISSFLSDLGSELDDLGRYKEAIKTFNESLGLDQKNVQALCNMGNTYRKVKRYYMALAAFDKVLNELDSNDAKAFYNRGNVYWDLKRYDEAISDYKNAIRHNPKYYKAYYNLSFAEFIKSRQDFTKATKIYLDELLSPKWEDLKSWMLIRFFRSC